MATGMRKMAQNRPEWIKCVTAAYQPVVIAAGERWCIRCGETMLSGDVCPRCGGVAWVDPRAILRPGEYVVS